MRIFVHEFASGGGFAGHDVPAALAREGRAMLTALVEDVAAIGDHEIATTADVRFALSRPRGVHVERVSSDHASVFGDLMAWADAVWLIAPETDRCLERLTARAERRKKQIVGSASSAVRAASNKAKLPHYLRRAGVRHPRTHLVRGADEASRAAAQLGYPVIVKPPLGAGCDGVRLARNGQELRRARSAQEHPARPVIVQEYVDGVAASVSLLSDGRRAVALSVNAQRLSLSFALAYRGGRTPLDHPLAARAAAAAVKACSAFPGLRGYVGVDVILTDTDAVVIEVNPRLTTAYLGVRAIIEQNVAALALAACEGTLPRGVVARRRVSFSAGGRVRSAAPAGRHFS